jgi:oligoendopeptidase F
MSTAAVTSERDRASIPLKYTWNLADIYPNDAEWRVAKERAAGSVADIEEFKGRLAFSAAVLANALEMTSLLDRDISRLYAYASMLADQDTRDAGHQGMRQEMVQLAATFQAHASYIQPEILRMPKDTIERFLSIEPRLAVYRFFLEDLQRRAAHTLGESEEAILAEAGPLAAGPSEIYSILANADFPYPHVTVSDGRTVKVNQAAYADLRASRNRADRERVMSAFFEALGRYSRTFGMTMNTEIQKVRFFAKSRRYSSSIEMSLDVHNIPLSVYHRLIEGVNRHLETFHRYLRLRKRMMNVDELHYYDLYAPFVGAVDVHYTPEEAQTRIVRSVTPLGAPYAAVVEQAFNERWIDLYPTEGKRSGAYSEGVYDVHPYMLINYNGRYGDVSTIAHELGHTMQSYLSDKTQPYPLAAYPIFVAEVASTFNEALLIDDMLSTIDDTETRLALLGNYLENIKGTVFRQTQFAEFELKMHERAQQGHPITGDALARMFLEITKRYYGHDRGICLVDDYITHEWSYIPHFYRDFYVYQYATSFTASLALFEKVKKGDAAVAERYLTFLSAGGSKYPIELLKDAGVDMTTDEPLDLTMTAMNRVMDEIETLISN